jgi:SUKH-4 immunity protein of toxin-antitoxin system
VDDAQLFARLAERGPVPYPGNWLDAPFPDTRVGNRTYAVIARDDGLSSIAVDRADGRVWLLSEDGEETGLVNSTVEALIACSLAYGRASDEVEEMEPEDQDDDMSAGDDFTDALVAEFRRIDTSAVAGENAFWSIAAEELGYALPS